jgi:transcription elongation factor GreA
MKQKYYETKRGEKIVNKLLDDLTKQALQVVKDIEYAKSFGDLSENAEYKEAKDMQREVSRKLIELTECKRNLHVVDIKNANCNQVSICATVHLLDLDTDEEKIYTIVGLQEADASKLLISYTSPLAKALMGKKLNDEIEFKPSPTAQKTFYYKVIKILYNHGCENINE